MANKTIINRAKHDENHPFTRFPKSILNDPLLNSYEVGIMIVIHQISQSTNNNLVLNKEVKSTVENITHKYNKSINHLVDLGYIKKLNNCRILELIKDSLI